MYKEQCKNKNSYLHTIIMLLVFIIITITMYTIYCMFIVKQQGLPYTDNSIKHSLSINSSNAILLNLNDKEVLFNKNDMEKIYPASMTKIMTAIVVLENINDLNESIVLSQKIYSDIYSGNAVIAGFSANEEVRIIDLLYGLLLPSGAECAIGLAEYIAGSESEFSSLMNDKAQELGMINTHFVNSTGLHDVQHYSSVFDISVLLEYALKNDVFYEIFTAERHSTPPTNIHDGGITYYSTLFSNMDNPSFDGGLILGGKTGYTEEAGKCLASLAKKNGNKYILVTSGAIETGKIRNPHIKDAFLLYSKINK